MRWLCDLDSYRLNDSRRQSRSPRHESRNSCRRFFSFFAGFTCRLLISLDSFGIANHFGVGANRDKLLERVAERLDARRNERPETVDGTERADECDNSVDVGRRDLIVVLSKDDKDRTECLCDRRDELRTARILMRLDSRCRETRCGVEQSLDRLPVCDLSRDLAVDSNRSFFGAICADCRENRVRVSVSEHSLPAFSPNLPSGTDLIFDLMLKKALNV
nr:MAG TPA: hypothetical protein [Caudoviricetes sp.]